MTFDHSWVADSIRCALGRLAAKPYHPVHQREQYDSLLTLHEADWKHRVKIFKEEIQQNTKNKVSTSSLDQLLNKILQP